ncbi:mucoidy inhibitor MuiA family protein [Limnofasciculus baicalensis]|uniref:DUF4139 domain-containing protein n=1 Tax=Limnofasciculus baicalensis BBK-W-15 TaxID=2699891 RepID=A0AAE3KU55_9CYAN|nr:mucoidy inhibitor MuiA family protein [Limnofasciculus baicalensis]MCP2731147.1 DUF4139 domain-containing protein [Limnofasciculus baicalensis BBK-W-15]
MQTIQLPAKIDKVKVYATGATITRIAEFSEISNGEVPEEVEIAGLPLALDDSSVRVRIESDGNRETIIPTDIRIGLTVAPLQDTPTPPAEEEIRQGKIEVQQLVDRIGLINNEITLIYKLNVPDRPHGEEGKAPPPSPIAARLAIANFQDEQIRAKLQEKQETEENLRKAKEHLENLQQKQQQASSAKEVQPHELRKTAIVRLSYEGDRTIVGQRLLIEYFVPGARWTPSYVCHLDSASNTAAIAIRALICQRTGEDWCGVSLELSTAQPMAWCELPELPSLRIGQNQPLVKKSGWRIPPVGVELLFEDYDRQKQAAVYGLSKRDFSVNLQAVKVPSFPNLKLDFSFPDEKISDKFVKTQDFQIFSSQSLNIPTSAGSVSNKVAERVRARKEISQKSLDGNTGESVWQERLSPMGSLPFDTNSFLCPKPEQLLDDNDISRFNFFTYSLMELAEVGNLTNRGKLSIRQQNEIYQETLKRQGITVTLDLLQIMQNAVSYSQQSLSVNLPPGGINVRRVAGSFDYAYNADGRVDVPSDMQFHSVALTSQSTKVDMRYIVVPREDTNVFRIAQLYNPLQAPLLSGAVDVYVNGEYILSTNIPTVPPKGQMELGLGVEQAIKVARNVTDQEVRSSQSLVSLNEMRHTIAINIANRLPKEAQIEVRERIPLPQDGAKVDVEIGNVSPNWEKYEQNERSAPIQGGYRWQIKVPGGQEIKLSAEYKIKTFVDSEVIGGNRRE